MKIAINTRYLLESKMEGFGVYSHEILRRMVAAHRDDHFHFFFDRPFARKYVYGTNVHPETLWPPARHPLLYRLWYQVKLKSRLEQEKPDVFFSPDSYMPLGMEIPSVLTVHDVAPRSYPHHITRAHRRYYLKNMPRFLAAAQHIITVSHFSKAEIQKYYGVPDNKISVIHNAVGPEFKPVDDSAQARVRARFTQGKPYFLYVGAIHPRKNVAELVKAFDLFKNVVDSDVQLVIAGQQSWKARDVAEAIDEAKFKGEIHLTGYIPAGTLPQLIGSALAMCYVSLYEGFGIPVLEAMACGVPVITSSEESTGAALAEVTADAALHVQPDHTESILQAMVDLYEDPELQSKLKSKGLDRAGKFSWDTAARQTYQVLRKAAGN